MFVPFLLRSKIGTVTVPILFNNTSCIYGCMKIGNWTIKFLSSLIPNITNFIS